MGSASDKETMAKAEPILEEAGIHYEVRVMSAHRTPDSSSSTAATRSRAASAC